MSKVISILILTLLTILTLWIFAKLSYIYIPILQVMGKVLFPFVLSFLIAYLLYPLLQFLIKRNIQRIWAICILYVVFTCLAAVFFIQTIPNMTKQMSELVDVLPKLTNIYREYVNMLFERTNRLPAFVHEQINEGLTKMEKEIRTIAEKSMEHVFTSFDQLFVVFIIPVIVFYVLNDYPTMKQWGKRIIPSTYHGFCRRLIKDLDISLGKYIRGMIFVCLAIGVLATIAFMMIGLPYSILLGSIIGLTNVIPYFGPILGAIPAVFIAFTISVQKVFFVLGIVFVLQFVEGNILSPIVVGKSLQIHPLFIIFLLFLGGEIWGIIGMIIIVPMYAILKIVLLHSLRLQNKD